MDDNNISRQEINKLESEYSGSIKTIVLNINKLLTKLDKTNQPFKINDATLNNAMDYIANYNKILVTFDIEFHNLVTKENSEYISIARNNKFVAPFVREIGAIFFAKDITNKWNYLGKFFVNFNNDIKGNNIIYVLSKYASVSENSRKLMDSNDNYFNILENINEIIENEEISEKDKEIKKVLKKNFIKNVLGKNDYGILKIFIGYLSSNPNKFKQTLDNIKRLIKDVPYNITRASLKPNELSIFNSQMKTYYENKDVRKRTISKDLEKELFGLLNQIDKYACFLVKGKMDFIALKNNYYALHKTICPIKFTYFYDIEIFNKLSNDKYGSAQLEKTFLGMSKTKLYKENVSQLIEKILGSLADQRAHNPLIDSLYTLAVALVINVSLNKTLE